MTVDGIPGAQAETTVGLRATIRTLAANRTGIALALTVSLALRLAAWYGLLPAQGIPQFDEQGYWYRAQGFAAVARAMIALQAPAAADLVEAYGGGTWPPLHSLLLGLALLVGGGTLAAARLVGIATSVLTTWGLYALTSRVAGRRAALAAAWTHACLPTFVLFSPLLWSESTYLMILMPIAIVATRLAARARTGPWDLVLAGILCGIAMLTRAVALPASLVVVALAARTGTTAVARTWRGALVAGVAVATLLPWQAVIRVREGSWIPLSTSTGLNLLVANNPWQREAGDQSLPFLNHQVQVEAQRTGQHPSAVARRLAIGAIAESPGRAITNVGLQARRLVAPDRVTMRSLLTAYFPPLPSSLVLGIASLLFLTVPLVLGLATVTMVTHRVARPPLAVLLALAGAHFVPPLVSVSNSRLALPALLLVLPIASAALETTGRAFGRRGVAALCGTVAAASVAASSWSLGSRALPNWESSAHYSALAEWTDELFPSAIGTFDVLELRRLPGAQEEVAVEILTPGYHFAGGESRWTWTTDVTPSVARLEVKSRVRTPLAPEILLTGLSSGRSVRLSPVRAALWWRFSHLGPIDVEGRWCGGEKRRAVARGLEPYVAGAG